MKKGQNWGKPNTQNGYRVYRGDDYTVRVRTEHGENEPQPASTETCAVIQITEACTDYIRDHRRPNEGVMIPHVRFAVNWDRISDDILEQTNETEPDAFIIEETTTELPLFCVARISDDYFAKKALEQNPIEIMAYLDEEDGSKTVVSKNSSEAETRISELLVGKALKSGKTVTTDQKAGDRIVEKIAIVAWRIFDLIVNFYEEKGIALHATTLRFGMNDNLEVVAIGEIGTVTDSSFTKLEDDTPITTNTELANLLGLFKVED